MENSILLVAALCKLYAGDPAWVAKEQKNCHAYYAQCVASSKLGATENAIWGCMLSRPAQEMADEVERATLRAKATRKAKTIPDIIRAADVEPTKTSTKAE